MKKGYLLGLLAVFVVFASLGSQCQKVMDPADGSATGYSSPEYEPPFSTSNFATESNCKNACDRYYCQLWDKEMERHKAIMQCLKGNHPIVKKLRRREIKRHRRVLWSIHKAHKYCRRTCHDQGGASGGF